MSRNSLGNRSDQELLESVLPERLEVELRDGQIRLPEELRHMSIAEIVPSGSIVLPAGTKVGICAEGAIHLNSSARVEACVELFFDENPGRSVRFDRFPLLLDEGAVLAAKK